MKLRNLKIFVIATILFCSQCTSEVVTIPCAISPEHPGEVSYTRDVFPIVMKSCAIPTCHVATFPKGDFTKYSDFKLKADNGMLSFKLSNGQMPPEFSKLPLPSPCEMNTITTWISQGAKNN